MHGARDHEIGALERRPKPSNLPSTDRMTGDCEYEKSGTRDDYILAVAGVAYIGRRSEHAPGDRMMFRRRLIRSDETWHDGAHHKLRPVNICR